jgi:type I restriction enzyme S subunit
MKRYEAYINTNLRFVGEVPEGWKRYRIKYLLSRSAAGVWGDDEKGDKNDIICFRVADFDYAHGGLKYDNLTLRNIEQSQRRGRLLSNGDLLIEKSGGGDATPVGRVVRFSFDEQAVCSNFIHSISVKENFSSNFLYYYFYSLYANKENLLYFNQTTGIQNLKVGEYLSQTLYLPSLAEQQAIGRWLDRKCEEIDKLMSSQLQQIALLYELRQSIITEVVTGKRKVC